MRNISKLLLTTVIGTTLTIGSLSATEKVENIGKIEKVNAFKNVKTEVISVKELNLLSGQSISPKRRIKRRRGFLGIFFKPKG